MSNVNRRNHYSMKNLFPCERMGNCHFKRPKNCEPKYISLLTLMYYYSSFILVFKLKQTKLIKEKQYLIFPQQYIYIYMHNIYLHVHSTVICITVYTY